MTSPAKESGSTLVTSLRSRVASLEQELSDTKDQLAEAKQSLSESNARCEALKRQLAAAPPGPAATPSAAAAGSPTTPLTTPAAPAAVEPGSSLGRLPEMSLLSPRGKFTASLCEGALVLQGKAAAVVVPYASIQAMWVVPEVDERGFVFACSLAAPVANGKSQLHAVTFVTKPADKEVQLALPGKEAAKGSAAHVLAQCLKQLAPGVRQGKVGGFRPADGPALRCYHKATEVAAYLLEIELLVKEGGKVLALPYAKLRAELLPPSGRRSFDIQLECAPAEEGGKPAGKPLKMELSMIAAEEFARVAEQLKGKRVNVNGCLDDAGGEGDEGGEGEGEGEEEDGEEGEDDDDSDDEDDEDFAPVAEEEPEEEYNERGGRKVGGEDDEDEGEEEDEGDDEEDEEGMGAVEGGDDDDEEEEEEGAAVKVEGVGAATKGFKVIVEGTRPAAAAASAGTKRPAADVDSDEDEMEAIRAAQRAAKAGKQA